MLNNLITHNDENLSDYMDLMLIQRGRLMELRKNAGLVENPSYEDEEKVEELESDTNASFLNPTLSFNFRLKKSIMRISYL